MASESLRDIRSYASGERERDPGAGRERSLSLPDSAAAAQDKELDIMEVGDTEGSSGKKEGSPSAKRPSTAGSRELEIATTEKEQFNDAKRASCDAFVAYRYSPV